MLERPVSASLEAGRFFLSKSPAAFQVHSYVRWLFEKQGIMVISLEEINDRKPKVVRTCLLSPTFVKLIIENFPNFL
jgi:aspartate/methionine/tyrosine aminotransferase